MFVLLSIPLIGLLSDKVVRLVPGTKLASDVLTAGKLLYLGHIRSLQNICVVFYPTYTGRS